MNRIYFDTFENSYTFEKDIFAPPERYFEVIPLLEDYMYTEIWAVDSEEEDFAQRISISYTKMDIENDEVTYLRDAIANEYSIKLLYMISWGIPKKEYDKIYKRLKGIKELIINYRDMKEDTALKEVNLNRLDSFLIQGNEADRVTFSEYYINYVKKLINSLEEDFQPKIYSLVNNEEDRVIFTWDNVLENTYYTLIPKQKDNIFIRKFTSKDKYGTIKITGLVTIEKEKFNDFIKEAIFNVYEK